MSTFKPVITDSNSLENVAKVDGQLVAVYDSGELYVDKLIGNNVIRTKYSDVVVDTFNNIDSLVAPSTDKIYFATDTHQLLQVNYGTGNVKEWIDLGGGGGGSSTLAGLTDVTISSPTSGQALVYNGSRWVNSVTTGSGGTKVVTKDGKISLQAVIDFTPYYTGNRGSGAVDLQHVRFDNSQVASGYCSVVMGFCNTASGAHSVAMGRYNTASGDSSVAMGDTNVADGYSSTIVGGAYNYIDSSAKNSFIIGGKYNTTSADFSAILGGAYNEAAHRYSVSCGQHCYNPFPSTAINRLGNMSSLPSGVFGHSGKLSVTVKGGDQVELMDFTKFIFSGILKLHYVIYLPDRVVLVEQTIYIADNTVVDSWFDTRKTVPARISGGIANRKLYSEGWQNAIMYQVGVDYTCLCEHDGGDGGYDYY